MGQQDGLHPSMADVEGSGWRQETSRDQCCVQRMHAMAPNTLLNVSGANSNGQVQAGIGRFERADFVQMESMRLSGSRFARSSNRKVYTGNRMTAARKAAALWHCNPSWNSGYSVTR